MARPPLEILGSLVGLLLGLVIAFSGYRLAKSLVGLAGFLVGAAVGLVVGFPFGGPIGSLVGALLLGVVFALLFLFAFRLVGGALGGSAAGAFALLLGLPTWLVVLAVIAGIVVGLVANRLVIVVASALLGGSLAAQSAIELFGDAGVALPWKDELAALALALVLAVFGAAAQWRTVRREA